EEEPDLGARDGLLLALGVRGARLEDQAEYPASGDIHRGDAGDLREVPLAAGRIDEEAEVVRLEIIDGDELQREELRRVAQHARQVGLRGGETSGRQGACGLLRLDRVEVALAPAVGVAGADRRDL